MKIVFATNNQHKLQEIREILGDQFEILSLADTGFHLDCEIIAAFQSVGGLDLIGTLYLLQMLQNQLVGQLRDNTFVAPAGEVFFIGDCLLTVASVHHVGGCEVRLSGEDVNDRFCRIRLKFLMFELEFHEVASSALVIYGSAAIPT